MEHDLSVLDYLSDYICCLYGVPGAYGVVTMPFSVREGIGEEFLPLNHLVCLQALIYSSMGLFPPKTFGLGTPVWSSKCQKQPTGYEQYYSVP